MQRKNLSPHKVLIPPGFSRTAAVAEFLRDRLVFDRDTTEVLDCGCGSGNLCACLSPFVRRITATDPAAGLIKELQNTLSAARRKNIRAVCEDFCALPRVFAGAQFDLIIAEMICHHIEDLEKFFLGIKTILKSDGIFCIIDLREEDGSFHAPNVLVPHRGLVPAKIVSLLASCGFFTITEDTPCVIRRATTGADGIRTVHEYPLVMFLADNFPPGGAIAKQ